MIARDQIGIVIVEPSETYQRILESILTKLGFTNLHKVGNPLKAMVMLQHNRSINVVIAELMMPSPDRGVDFVKQIRKRYTADQLPVLMMTNLSEKEYVQQSIAAGVNGYLIKPVDPAHLEAHLWRLFDLPLRGSQRMGEYMIQKRIITPEQRDLALKFQKEYSSDHHAMSVMAYYLGYLPEKMLINIVFKQQMDDELFFRNATPLGLTPKQISHLQEIKQKFRMRIGDIMVKLGFISETRLNQVLKDLKNTLPEEAGEPK